MKKLLLLFLLFSFLEIRGQSGYYPFPDSNAVWNWHFLGYYCAPFIPFDEEYSYTITGDTLINSVLYHKLETPFVQINNFGCTRLNTLGYLGCIRQSIVDKKVFCILPNDTTEQLIFDFNLQIGDTLPTIYDSFCYSKIVVSAVDSVLIGSVYRKRWSGGGIEIIEGIGSNFEFLKPMCEIIDGVTGILACFMQDGVTIYLSSVNNCSLITSIKSIPGNFIGVKLYPNPFISSMTVSINSENALMSIFNSRGEFIRKEEINNYSSTIERNTLSEGVYFYKLISEDGKFASGTFVVY